MMMKFTQPHQVTERSAEGEEDEELSPAIIYDNPIESTRIKRVPPKPLHTHPNYMGGV